MSDTTGNMTVGREQDIREQDIGDKRDTLTSDLGVLSTNVLGSAERLPKSVSICDTQPVTAEGVRNLLSGAADLRFLETVDSLKQAADLVRRSDPDVLILDKAFGIQAVLDWLGELRAASGVPGPIPAPPKTSFVIWGVSVTE